MIWILILKELMNLKYNKTKLNYGIVSILNNIFKIFFKYIYYILLFQFYFILFIFTIFLMKKLINRIKVLFIYF
jgi:hypothetical protein